MFLCCVTCISDIVWLYCLKFGVFLAEEETVYVFVCLPGIRYKIFVIFCYTV